MVLICIGAVLGALAVAAGALSSHLLAGQFDASALTLWDLANRYHFYHTLALVFIGALYEYRPHFLLRGAGILMAVGVILFSGSLYVLTWAQAPVWGNITPIGGGTLIAAWVVLALAAATMALRR